MNPAALGRLSGELTPLPETRRKLRYVYAFMALAALVAAGLLFMESGYVLQRSVIGAIREEVESRTHWVEEFGPIQSVRLTGKIRLGGEHRVDGLIRGTASAFITGERGSRELSYCWVKSRYELPPPSNGSSK